MFRSETRFLEEHYLEPLPRTTSNRNQSVEEQSAFEDRPNESTRAIPGTSADHESGDRGAQEER